jgi:hypothetical protein
MTEPTTDLRELPVFTSRAWQMSYGERAALEGVLQVVQPRLAIEIGRAEGGSLRRIAAHSEHVISFDLVQDAPEAEELPNVTLIVGDSHQQLPEKLAELAAAGTHVDFALVDGDHSAEGARADMIDLLESPAVQNCVILAHDGLNEHVRAGLDSVPYEDYNKVVWVDLDFVPGYVAEVPEYHGHCWGGLGLVIVDEPRSFNGTGDSIRNPMFFPHPQVMWEWARMRREGAAPAASGQSSEAAALRAERDALQLDLERHRDWLESIQGSVSWRITAPLRAAKGRLKR